MDRAIEVLSGHQWRDCHGMITGTEKWRNTVDL